jgi:mRNA-degrading endonuclease RelE of RelBE toxin-antitoxin system
MYKITLHKKAAKRYEKLDDKTSARLNKAMDALKENPFYGRDIKRLRNIERSIMDRKKLKKLDG